MKKLLFLIVLLGGLIGFLIWTWDGQAPTVQFKGARSIGRKGTVSIDVRDAGRGLRAVEVVAVQGNRRETLLRREWPKLPPWKKSEPNQILALSPADKKFKNGEVKIEVKATDQPNLLLFSRETSITQSFAYDTRPPELSIISQQHYIKQGGSETVLYRVSPDAKQSGVKVGDVTFVGYPVPGQKDLRICPFALGWDQSADTQMFLFAEDEAGNLARVGFWKKVFPAAFRKRSLPITDEFIQTVVPEILNHTEEITEKATPLESYLEINRVLRKANNDQISKISRQSADHPLWSKPFLQLTNSQVEAVFADQRTYMYKDKMIDQQTHLGFDLATSAQNPVEASNDGVVAFADYLGIYGNCVIVDHGLGLQSLYGHLSSIGVKPGQKIRLGQEIGRTGMTGLAGGDHLHFSMVLQGVQVNPVEWWDPKWVEVHVFSRLRGEALATPIK